MIKNKHIVIGAIVVIAILVLSFAMPLQWSVDKYLVKQLNHDEMVGAFGISNMGYGQEMKFDEDVRISKAEAYLRISVAPEQTVTVYGGISTTLTPDYNNWIWYENIQKEFGLWTGWQEFTSLHGDDYAEISSGDLVYFIVAVANFNPASGNTITWYGDKFNPYIDGNLWVTISSGDSETSDWDGAFQLYGNEWIDPGLDVICWACQGDTPVSQVFPPGTICGAGSAVSYPYTTEPTDCGGGGSDQWDLTVIAEDKDTGDVLVGADISISGPISDSGTTDSDGEVLFELIDEGTYTISGTMDGYDNPDDITVNLYQDREITLKFHAEGNGNGGNGDDEGIEITMGMIIAAIVAIVAIIIGAILPIAIPYRVTIIILGILLAILLYLILEGLI